VWRCHIGVDEAGPLAREAWDFLRADIEDAHACVFSRAAYAWDGLPPARVTVLPPCIDALSPKNNSLAAGEVDAILRVAGLEAGPPEPSGVRFRRADGSEGAVTRPAKLIEDAPVPQGAPLVLQVSRWDRLKDPIGVLDAFVRLAGSPLDDGAAHLVLAGPATSSVDDDPESEETFDAVRRSWEEASAAARSRVHLAQLPMDDVDENATIVNALQRRAAVVLQKSLVEGFGLTVAEAMWKERPVIGSRVGGIQDQIVHGESGVLVDPGDVGACATAIGNLLRDSERAARMGVAAHRRVCDHFLPQHHFAAEADLLERLG
jgi:trehalose synthase